jgi:hypothetical protein
VYSSDSASRMVSGSPDPGKLGISRLSSLWDSPTLRPRGSQAPKALQKLGASRRRIFAKVHPIRKHSPAVWRRQTPRSISVPSPIGGARRPVLARHQPCHWLGRWLARTKKAEKHPRSWALRNTERRSSPTSPSLPPPARVALSLSKPPAQNHIVSRSKHLPTFTLSLDQRTHSESHYLWSVAPVPPAN